MKERNQHTKQYRKSIALVAAMRLKRYQPDESLEILSIYDDIDVNIRYMRALSHTYLNQFNQVFRLLEMTIAEPDNDRKPKIPDQLVILDLFFIVRLCVQIVCFINKIEKWFLFLMFAASKN